MNSTATHSIYRAVMLPSPATWPIERLATLREHIATQDLEAVATMAGCYGPQSPIKFEGELLTVRQVLMHLDGWVAGRWGTGWNQT